MIHQSTSRCSYIQRLGQRIQDLVGLDVAVGEDVSAMLSPGLGPRQRTIRHPHHPVRRFRCYRPAMSTRGGSMNGRPAVCNACRGEQPEESLAKLPKLRNPRTVPRAHETHRVSLEHQLALQQHIQQDNLFLAHHCLSNICRIECGDTRDSASRAG